MITPVSARIAVGESAIHTRKAARPNPNGIAKRWLMIQPWNESWNGWPRNSSAIWVIAAIRRAICAGHAMGAREQASRNAPLAGFDWRLHLVLATYRRAEAVPVVAAL
jgi:hypothetical protein